MARPAVWSASLALSRMRSEASDRHMVSATLPDLRRRCGIGPMIPLLLALFAVACYMALLVTFYRSLR